jgi:hypothetical protein
VRSEGFSLKVKITDLLAACSDANGGTITLTGTGAGNQGATITQSAGHLLYSAASGAEDTFSYTISDGQGGSATGMITVQVVTPDGLIAGVTTAPGGAVTAHFAGIPGLSYSIERSTNLSTWTVLQTVTAPANGLFDFTDNDGLPIAFYRLHYNAVPPP